jgi:hypothetical protein
MDFDRRKYRDQSDHFVRMFLKIQPRMRIPPLNIDESDEVSGDTNDSQTLSDSSSDDTPPSTRSKRL